MSIPGLGANSQQEALANSLSTQDKTQKETLRLPGIETLHEKSTEEIASVLANVIKSRAGIVALTYKVGEGIEVVYDGNPYDQFRG